MADLTVSFTVKGLGERTFFIGRDVTDPFGFFYQERVSTPRGPASVIGVFEGNLYFVVDGDEAASYWSTCKDAAAFVSRGFTHIKESLPPPNSSHRLKRVLFIGVERTIVLQNLNGPCPIIALANALLLTGAIALPSDCRTVISSPVLRGIIQAHLLVPRAPSLPRCPPRVGDRDTLGALLTEDRIGTVRSGLLAKGEKFLELLYEGLLVTPIFSHIDAFDAAEDCAIFALSGCRLLHGWVISPDDAAAELRDKAYDEVALLAVDDSHALAAVARVFLSESCSQLTSFGLSELQSCIREGELTVLFRNNHFSALTKLQGRLLLVVSDEGYAQHEGVVFEALTLSGSGTFADGSGAEVPAVVLGVMSAHGSKWTVSQINNAVAILQSTNQAATLESVIRVLEADIKTATASSTPAAAPQPEATAAPLAILPPPTTNELAPSKSDAVQQLMSMGFSENDAWNAMLDSESVEEALGRLVH